MVVRFYVRADDNKPARQLNVHSYLCSFLFGSDCNVPFLYGDDLGRWVADQRQAYMDDRLTAERIAALEALGLFDEKDDEESEFEEEGEDEPTAKAPARVKVTLAEKWETQYDNLVRFYKYVQLWISTANIIFQPCIFHGKLKCHLLIKKKPKNLCRNFQLQ